MDEKRYKYSKRDISELKKFADIRLIIPGLKGYGNIQYCTCPQCGESRKGKGLQAVYKPEENKNFAHCFKCGFSISDPISAYQYYFNSDFLEAAEAVASLSRRPLIEQNKNWEKKIHKRPKQQKTQKSFCEEQLEASGLTVKDVTARWKLPDGSVTMRPTFTSGGVDFDKGWSFNDTDDEMLIHYLDLEGNPVYFQQGKGKNLKEYIRVRWSNPQIHLDKKGKSIKYQTPYNAPLKFYFPQVIRNKYQNIEEIETLFIQEGEKKAEKACKHGIMSVGIQGIYNIGSAETGLIKELQLLVKRCKVKKIVMVMDSDWDNLSSSLSENDRIDARPKQFAGAVIKFKDYIETINNKVHSVDIYWAHVNKNEAEEKGIDDLLVGTLKGREEELLPAIVAAMNEHDGKGKFLDVHKISSISDYDIRNFWDLNSSEDFFKRYAKQISKLTKFSFGKVAYVREADGNIKIFGVSTGQLWTEEITEKGKDIIKLKKLECLKFLEANGYRGVNPQDEGSNDFCIVQISNNTVAKKSTNLIYQYLFEHVKQMTKNENVHEEMLSQIPTVLTASQFIQLKKIKNNFDEPTPGKHYFLFNNAEVEVDSEKITAIDPLNYYWKSRQITRNFERVEIFKDASKYEDYYNFEFTDEGSRCEFLEFLIDTCNFTGKELKDLGEDELKPLCQHLMNKLTAIGYLICEYKFPQDNRAVVAMDGRISEVGESNGRSGKSLIGQALMHVQPVVTIDGRQPGVETDNFIFSEVTMATRTIFIDDVRARFNYDRLYSMITNDMHVNAKGVNKVRIHVKRSPKFYITTNHAISATEDSTEARVAIISFSSYYNKNYSPATKFGHAFFDSWDEEQWNLFYNLMTDCVRLYLRSIKEAWENTETGIVKAPQNNIMKRNLRQQMGEAFTQWAEMKFAPDGDFVNCRLNRQDLFKDFHDKFPGNMAFVSASKFRKNMECYAQYAGMHLNITRKHKKTSQSFQEWKKNHPADETVFIGERLLSNNVEYFILSLPGWEDKIVKW